MTPFGIETATFRFVAQHLNHCATAVPKIVTVFVQLFFFHSAAAPSGAGPPHYRSFGITLGRTPLDERSARRRDLYLTTHNTRKRETSMPTAGFEAPIPPRMWPQTHTLDREATGMDYSYTSTPFNVRIYVH